MARLLKLGALAVLALIVSPLICIVAAVAAVLSFAAPDFLQRFAPFPLRKLRAAAIGTFTLSGLITLGLIANIYGNDEPDAPEVAAALVQATNAPTAAVATAVPTAAATADTITPDQTLAAVDGQVTQLSAAVDRLNSRLSAAKPDARGWQSMTASELDTIQFLITQAHGNTPAPCLQDGYTSFLATLDGLGATATTLQTRLTDPTAVDAAAVDFAGANDTIRTAADSLRAAAGICH